jgi:preprotein translocase subunit SecA
MNKQREVIYSHRRTILEGLDIKEEIWTMVEELLDEGLGLYLSNQKDVEADTSSLCDWLKNKFSLSLDKQELDLEKYNSQDIKADLFKKISEVFAEKEKSFGSEEMRHLARMILLQIIDTKWKDHLYIMDNLREGIGLRAYGQRDPLIEYQNEAFNLFSTMMQSIKDEAVELIFNIQMAPQRELKGVFSSIPQQFLHPEAGKFEKPQEQPAILSPPPFAPRVSVIPPPASLTTAKVGRNEPCPCGAKDPVTGNPIKYKKCCGR